MITTEVEENENNYYQKSKAKLKITGGQTNQSTAGSEKTEAEWKSIGRKGNRREHKTERRSRTIKEFEKLSQTEQKNRQRNETELKRNETKLKENKRAEIKQYRPEFRRKRCRKKYTLSNRKIYIERKRSRTK